MRGQPEPLGPARGARPLALQGLVPVELLGNSSSFPFRGSALLPHLPRYGFYWFRLAREAAAPRWHQESPPYAEPPVLVLRRPADGPQRGQGSPCASHAQISQLEREALRNFLGTRRWFAAKGGGIERVEVVAQAAFGHAASYHAQVHVGRGASEGGEPQLYFLPLSAAWEEARKGTASRRTCPTS